MRLEIFLPNPTLFLQPPWYKMLKNDAFDLVDLCVEVVDQREVGADAAMLGAHGGRTHNRIFVWWVVVRIDDAS